MSKRPWLSDFGRVSHVTARALAQILREVREQGLPDAVSSSSIRRHRREDVRRQTDFGDLLQEVPVVLASGGEGSMWVQHPLAMLATVAAEFAEIAEFDEFAGFDGFAMFVGFASFQRLPAHSFGNFSR